MQPGQTINPGQPVDPEQLPPQEPQQPDPQLPQTEQSMNESQQPAAAASPTPPSEPQPAPAAPQDPLPASVEEPASWQFSEEADTYDQESFSAMPSAPMVNWTASEYIAHDKNAGWYGLVILSAVAVAALVLLITRDWVSPVVVVILGIAFAAFGARQPEVLEYSIDNSGVRIGQKHYPFGLFRTFSVIEEDAVRSILLMPLQRFNLPISVYYDPADEQKIIEALSVHLPHEERRMSPVDSLMRKIRF